MSFLDRVNECNNFHPQGLLPLFVDNICVGMLKEAFAEHLVHYDGIFSMGAERAIELNPDLYSFELRNHAIAEMTRDMLERGIMSYVLDEPYVVTAQGRDEALFLIDRALVPYFGFRSFGQHLNGFVRDGENLFMWIAKRASDRRIFPGRLDNLVAGGLPHGISLADNLQKECMEEAGMSAELSKKAVPVGAVSYNAIYEKGYKADTLYCYDLELPENFEPRCTDGEVESFELQPVEEVMEIVNQTQRFKPNCNLVLIDFFIRHGLITPEYREYLALQTGLHVPFAYNHWL